MTDFEVHELPTRNYYFNVCNPKKDEHDLDVWHMDFEVETKIDDDCEVHVITIRCLSDHMDGSKMFSRSAQALLCLIEHLKGIGWKLE